MGSFSETYIDLPVAGEKGLGCGTKREVGCNMFSILLSALFSSNCLHYLSYLKNL